MGFLKSKESNDMPWGKGFLYQVNLWIKYLFLVVRRKNLLLV